MSLVGLDPAESRVTRWRGREEELPLKWGRGRRKRNLGKEKI